MIRNKVNSEKAPSASGGYSQAVDISSFDRVLFISGQIPVSHDGEVPPSFKDQAFQVWKNIEAQLHACDMEISDIVKVNIYLSDRKYNTENREVRDGFLGNLQPALTVIITGIFDEEWLLEIEAIAAK